VPNKRNSNLFASHAVDKAVAPHDQLTNVVTTRFRNYPAGVWEESKVVGCLEYARREHLSSMRRLSGNVEANRVK
jgi:hypothetical protein